MMMTVVHKTGDVGLQELTPKVLVKRFMTIVIKDQGRRTKPILALELSGIFLRVLARAFFPWVRKLHDGKTSHFSKRYIYSAIGSVIAGMIVTVLIFPKFDTPSMGQGAEAGVRLFAMTFGFGFGWHAIVDEVAKWAGAFKDET